MRQAGEHWLANCAPHAKSVHRRWEAGKLAAVPSGRHWDVVEAPLVRSIEIMPQIRVGALGPVLACARSGRAWWLVPLEAAEQCDDIPDVTVLPSGTPLLCPPPLRALDGRTWLVRPDGSGQLTDSLMLGAAFGPGGLAEAW